VTWNGAKIPRGHGHPSSEPFLPYRAIPCMPPPPWIDAMQEARGAAHLGKLRSARPITAAGGARQTRRANSRGSLTRDALQHPVLETPRAVAERSSLALGPEPSLPLRFKTKHPLPSDVLVIRRSQSSHNPQMPLGNLPELAGANARPASGNLRGAGR
jgi:hypothetical protein